MKFEDFIEQLKLEFEKEVKTEDDLIAFLKRTEMTLIKSQVILEINDLNNKNGNN